MGKPYVEHTGERYGRLTVIEYAGKEFKRGSWYRAWRCLCDCGQSITVLWPDLKDGSTRSCGCLQSENRALYGGAAGANRLPTGASAFRQLLILYRKSARERGYAFDLNEDEFRSIIEQPCYYCSALPSRTFPGVKGTNGEYVCNGIDRIDSTIGYVKGNVRPSCWICNRAKADMPEADFLAWVARIASFLSLS
ncbi:MAG: hypothetical protein ACLQUY_12625 [Ktedonobacterales bacterium]